MERVTGCRLRRNTSSWPSTTAFQTLLSSSIPTGSSFPPIPRSRSNSVMHRMKSPTVRCGYFMLRIMTTTLVSTGMHANAPRRMFPTASTSTAARMDRCFPAVSVRPRSLERTARRRASSVSYMTFRIFSRSTGSERRPPICSMPQSRQSRKGLPFSTDTKSSSPSMKPIAAFWARLERVYRQA